MVRSVLPILLLVNVAVAQQSSASSAATCKVIPVDATDGPIAAPLNHKVLYEDLDIRVLEVVIAPHSREPTHTHARPAVMYIDSGTKPFTGFIAFEGPHANENKADVLFHAIRVEFKHPGCSLSPTDHAAKPTASDALLAAPLAHSLLFENDDVRVLDVHLSAHEREPMHTHAWPSIFYIIQGVPIRYFTPTITDQPIVPAPSASIKIAYILAEGPHSVENMGDITAHAIRFEIKHASEHATPSPRPTNSN